MPNINPGVVTRRYNSRSVTLGWLLLGTPLNVCRTHSYFYDCNCRNCMTLGELCTISKDTFISKTGFSIQECTQCYKCSTVRQGCHGAAETGGFGCLFSRQGHFKTTEITGGGGTITFQGISEDVANSSPHQDRIILQGSGLPWHRENREFESPFFQRGKTQGIC